MKRYIIEREIAGVGRLDAGQLGNAAAKSNAALAKLGGRVQWVHSYVAEDKTFCVYLADGEPSVQEHARISGFPASRITEVRTVSISVRKGWRFERPPRTRQRVTRTVRGAVNAERLRNGRTLLREIARGSMTRLDRQAQLRNAIGGPPATCESGTRDL